MSPRPFAPASERKAQPITFPRSVSELEADVEAHLGRLGKVFAVIDHRVENYSGNVSYSVEIAGDRWFVKTAIHANGIEWLEQAVRFHSAVQHPAVVPLAGRLPIEGEGLALVYPWFEGEILNDPTAPGSLPRDDPGSAYQRFRALPVDRVLDVVDLIFDAHLSVVAAGFVAVELYDGCVMYDFATGRLGLIDLDSYCPGPYVLDLDRQFGSSRFMAPEEFRRGATIDERTTVFNLGRTAFVFLSQDPEGAEDEQLWRTSPALYYSASIATRPHPADRYPSLAGFVAAWREARLASA